MKMMRCDEETKGTTFLSIKVSVLEAQQVDRLFFFRAVRHRILSARERI